MRNKYFIIVILLIAVIFRDWWVNMPLAAGDWHFFFSSSLNGYFPGIWAWDFSFGNGMGGSDIFLLGLNSYFMTGSYLLMNILSFPWWIVERIMWFWPFLVLSILSSYALYTALFKDKGWTLAVLLFISNTYTLMLIGGGQVGVAMAFSLAPLVIGLWIKCLKYLEEKREAYQIMQMIVLNGFVFGLQIFFDLRIVYITLCAIFLCTLFSIRTVFLKKYIVSLLIIFIIAFLLNVFWIFPQAVLRENPIQQVGTIYSSERAVKFFSFASFENTLGLLHPNWPENIFGKVGFMKPEFLLLPILVFSSLLFIGLKKSEDSKKETLYVTYLTLLGLLGAFLAKGANDPFGGLYLWMFTHIPGFIMFRDPTKWYLLVVLSYSMLIPFSVSKIYEFLKRRFA